MVRDTTIIPLKQWIRGALNSVGSSTASASNALAPAYVASSLRIAVSLSEQLRKLEESTDANQGMVGSFLMDSEVHWSEIIKVLIETNVHRSSSCNHASVAVATDRDGEAPVLSEQVEDALKSLQVQEFDGVGDDEAVVSQNAEDNTALLSRDVEDFLTTFEDNVCNDIVGRTGLNGDKERAIVRFCYFNVKSAEISCSTPYAGGSDCSIKDVVETDRHRLRRIYNLGLVLYELFSGGDIPPPELFSLLSYDGAFVSLTKHKLTNDDKGSHCSGTESKRQRGQELGICEHSLEFLKIKGLPLSICNLIFNMLDCIHGSLSNDDCYMTMADVTTDLQLMIDKPFKFLHDLTVDELALTDLKLYSTAFNREEEFTLLQSSFRRSVSGSYEIVLVSGQSGTGKSWLAHRLGRLIIAERGFFLKGKFDKMMQFVPFLALTSAFSQYCDLLIMQKDSDWAKTVTCQLQLALGQDACHLMKLIPNLSQILHVDMTGYVDSLSDEDYVHSQHRLHFLLCIFVEVISTFSNVTVTLFLDDVQWADAASISVLNQLLKNRRKNFFFIGCCRDDDMGIDHPFWKMIQSSRMFGIETTIVELKCVTKDDINALTSDLLFLSPRVVRSLSDIVYSKTKGNPLFFSQLMRSLCSDGLLRLNLGRRRWEWDTEKIYSCKLPDNVAHVFTSGIRRLPTRVQSALFTLSCFGASVSVDLIQTLEPQLKVTLVEPLKGAIAEGLIRVSDNCFHFCHDRIQEAAYNMRNEDERSESHLRYGRILLQVLASTRNDEMLLTAVNQINLGGPSAGSGSYHSATLAKCNLKAGKISVEMSNFLSAFSFFSHGIDFLPDNHWQDHYRLSLELFEYAAKCALAIGHATRLRDLSDQVLQNARCFEDTLNILFTTMSSLASAAKILESATQGFSILSSLGEEIPKTLSHESLTEHIEQTQLMIRGISEDDLLGHKMMNDKKKEMTMKVLSKMEMIILFVNPNLQPFVTLRMIQLTISHGLCVFSPIAFAYFGGLLALLGDIRIGYRFAVLARSLLDRVHSKEVVGETMNIATNTICFVEPLLSAREYFTQGSISAMAGGNVDFACINRLQFCAVSFYAGVNLVELKDIFSEAFLFLKEQEHSQTFYFLLALQGCISALMGEKPVAPINDELSEGVLKTNTRQLMAMYFHNMYLNFILNNDDKTRHFADLYFASKINVWYLLIGDSYLTFIGGLVSFRLFRDTRNQRWLDIGQECKAKMKVWSEQGSSWNFHHKYLLMEAEENYCNNNCEFARTFYTDAISSAKSHKCINDEALACELAANFYLSLGDNSTSLEFFICAHKKYHEWGALAKVTSLFEFVKERFAC